MARTLQQQLDDLDSLISTLENAQGLHTTTTQERTLMRERLQALYAERRQLQKDLDTGAGTAGGGRKFWLGRFKSPL